MDRKDLNVVAILLVPPVVVSLVAMAILAWLPARLLLTDVYPAVRVVVIVGLVWMFVAWGVAQYMVVRRRRAGR